MKYKCKEWSIIKKIICAASAIAAIAAIAAAVCAFFNRSGKHACACINNGDFDDDFDDDDDFISDGNYASDKDFEKE